MIEEIETAVEKLNERYLSNLTEQDLVLIFENVTKKLNLNESNLKRTILSNLFDLHRIDDDFSCTGFYFDLQEVVDSRLVNHGIEPTKDQEFSEACRQLMSSGKMEKLTTLNPETRKFKYGFRLSIQYVKQIQEITTEEIKNYIANKQ